MATARVRDYAGRAVRSQPETEGRPMALGFMYRLEHADGTPVDPPWSAIEQLLDHDRVRAVSVWARAAPDRDVVGP